MLRFCQRGIQRSNVDPWLVNPSRESLEHTLSILKPTIVNVRRTQAFGIVPEALLDIFLGSTPNMVQSLGIRTRGGHGAFSYEDLTCPSTTLSAWLESLALLNQLQDLDIHEVTRDEAPRLAIAIPKLTRLQRLVVADEGEEHSEWNGLG